MRRLRIIGPILVLALLQASSGTFGQSKRSKSKAAKEASARGVDLITAAQLKDYLYFIASDEMEGRDTPSRGLNTTAKFIAMNLSRWGLKPAGGDGSYFQRIALSSGRLDTAATYAEINGQRFTFGEDFLCQPNAGFFSAPLVYAGHGWVIKSKGVDAYKGVDVKDKIIVVSGEGLPKGLTRLDLGGTRGEDWTNPLLYAEQHGAKAVLVIPNQWMLDNWDQARRRAFARGAVAVEKFQNQTARVPSIWLSEKMAEALFQGEKYDAKTILDRSVRGEQEPFELSPNKHVKVSIAAQPESLATQNVVALFEGGDPVLKDEYVALGAHYDHIGDSTKGGQCPPVKGDTICNGADDDGSGTTALLAMAEALSHASVRPKRSVLFVWHTGEEKGLWGSRYFTEYPTVPLDHIVTQLNIDMIGRSKKEGDTNPRNRELSGPNEIYVIGSRMMSTELGELGEMVNSSFLNLTFNYRYDNPADPNRFFFRSDHYNYARKGIPIIFYFDGVHEDYHRPGDEPQKIDYQKMEKVSRTFYMTLWEIANRPARPKVDKQLPVSVQSR
jgi:hypothetical protein